jgi:hypothetical protein
VRRLVPRPRNQADNHHRGHAAAGQVPAALARGNGSLRRGLARPRHRAGSDWGAEDTARQRLGHKEQAQDTLAQLREIVKQPRWTRDGEALGFLREAETLPQGPAPKSKL